MHIYYDKRYEDYNPDSFIIQARRTVYKWWCVVYKPVYKLTHEGRWPEEKEPYNMYPTRAQMEARAARADVSDMAEQAIAAADDVLNSREAFSPVEPEVDLSKVDENTMDKANEIMARLAREAAEDEAKKQAEINVAKKQAQEKEKLDMIMQANKVDITSFIEEGKASRTD